MDYYEKGSHVVVENLPHFNLSHTFLCGQCFRWDKQPDGSFAGVAMGRYLRISCEGQAFVFHNTDLNTFLRIWMPYFDLAGDYGARGLQLSVDDRMRRAVAFGWGIHLLQQETFECLLSYIISANNHIPRIKTIISALCTRFGEKIIADGKVHYTFPSPAMLSGVTEADLAPLKAGYRTKYILDAVQKVIGSVDLSKLKTLPLSEAKRQLMQIKGVGSKVADCVLLFGAGRFGAFPVDVWVGRAMRGFYPEVQDVQAAGEQKFGELCGLAQQYIFYYAREQGLFK